MNIKELRTKLGMTQKAFANYFDIPLQNVQHWEQGFRNPPEYVLKLVNRLACLEFPDVLTGDAYD